MVLYVQNIKENNINFNPIYVLVLNFNFKQCFSVVGVEEDEEDSDDWIVFMLDNKLYDFAIEYREISLLHFMHYLRMNQNYVITSMEIPRFCYHPLLSIAANCRMCLVEEIGAPKLIVSCANIIKPHASYFSMNVLIRNVREHILEYLLLNHPLDCPICDQGGECDLQDITKVYGLDNSRYFNKIKKAVVFKDFNNFFIKFKMTRCIHCTRCIRFFNEILDINLLGLINRGFSMKISYFTENLYQYKANAFGNVADICPVGALTLANTEDRIRAWELIQKYTIDIFDSFGSDIRIDWSGSELFRVLPCINEYVNDSWITDITRFSYNGLKIQRLTIPFFCTKSKKYLDLKYTDWAFIFNLISEHFFINKFILKKKINFTGLTGIFSDAKSILSLKYFLHYLGSSNIETTSSSFSGSNVDFRKYYTLNLSRIDWRSMRVLILVGIDVRLEAPLLFIKINYYKKQLLIFYFGNSLKVDKFVHHVGLGLSNLFSFFEGKHYISSIVLDRVFKSVNIKTLHFFLGYNLVKRKDFPNIINAFDSFLNFMTPSYWTSSWKIWGWINRHVQYGVVLPFIGRITGSELGITPFNNKLTLLNKDTLIQNKIILKAPLNYNIFLNNFDDYEKNIIKNPFNFFSIFIGSHLNDSLVPFFDVVLPSSSFLEKSSFFWNTQGFLRISRSVAANSYVLPDYIIISLLFKKICGSANILNYSHFSFNNLVYLQDSLLFFLLDKYNLIAFSKKLFNIELKTEKKINKVFNNFIYNFTINFLGLYSGEIYKIKNNKIKNLRIKNLKIKNNKIKNYKVKYLKTNNYIIKNYKIKDLKLKEIKDLKLKKNTRTYILNWIVEKYKKEFVFNWRYDKSWDLSQHLINHTYNFVFLSKTIDTKLFILMRNRILFIIFLLKKKYKRSKLQQIYTAFYSYIYLFLLKFYYLFYLRTFFNIIFKRVFYFTLFFINNSINKVYSFVFDYFNHILACDGTNNSIKILFFKEKRKKEIFLFKEYFFKFNFLNNITKDFIGKPLNNTNYSNIFLSRNLEVTLETKLKMLSGFFIEEIDTYWLEFSHTVPYGLHGNKKYFFWQAHYQYDVILPVYNNIFEANQISRNSLEIQGLLTSYNKFFSYYK